VERGTVTSWILGITGALDLVGRRHVIAHACGGRHETNGRAVLTGAGGADTVDSRSWAPSLWRTVR